MYYKKLDLPSYQKIAFTHPEKLQIVLLSQVKTKNNQEYPYLMLFLENSVPKYYVYPKEIEIEKEYGENIGSIPVGYRKEMIKAYLIQVYDQIGDQSINSKIIENLEEDEFAEMAVELIIKGSEELISKILEVVKKIVSKQLEKDIEEVKPESSFFNDLGSDDIYSSDYLDPV